MSATTKKSLLVVVRHSPYGTSLARSSLEVALSSATFDQRIGLLFMGDGVLHLLPDQDSSRIGVRNIARLIASFPLYDLNELFIDRSSMERFGLQSADIPQNSQCLDDDGMQQLFVSYDHILGF